MTEEELLRLFKLEVTDRAKSIDRDDEYCWLSLTVGWLLGKGVEVERAKYMATYIRYNTDLT